MINADEAGRVATRLLFLQRHLGDVRLEALQGDAGSRSYFRVHHAQRSWILVEYAAEDEGLGRFLQLSEALRSLSLPVPQIEARDVAQKRALLSDFGDVWLWHVLQNERETAMASALNMLQKWQENTLILAEALPSYDEAVLQRESALFAQWFLPYCGLTLHADEEALLAATLKTLHAQILQAPRVVIHRDYHSRNLMMRPRGLGILDYQDALWGHQSYDLIALTRDAYMTYSWEERRVWEESFRVQIGSMLSASEWKNLCDISALQRHLKVLGIFVRLAQRDGKSAYLPYLKQVLDDTRFEAARIAPALLPLLQRCVLPEAQR